jgi:thiosulfate reductase cytochrome b subunit
MQYTNIDNPLIQFNNAVAIHNFVGVLTSISYICYFIANFYTNNYKHYKFKLKGLVGRLMKQGEYYVIGYLKGLTKPFPISLKEKFNPLQRLSYFATMYILVPAVVITGIALLYPEMILERFYNMSGIRITAFLHSLAGFFILIFVIIHLYVITIGKNPLKNFKSIIDGYHDADGH